MLSEWFCFQHDGVAVDGADATADALVSGALPAAKPGLRQTGTDAHRKSRPQSQQEVREREVSWKLVDKVHNCEFQFHCKTLVF